MKNQLQDSQSEVINLNKKLEYETSEVDKHTHQISLLEASQKRVKQETEESQAQVVLMKEKIKGFKDTMDKIIVKLGNVKQQVLDLRSQNEELLYQNEKLNVRAARGFEALTPRPDYRKLREEKRLDFEVYDPTGRRQIMPTIKIVEELINRNQAAGFKDLGLAKKTSNKLAIPKMLASNIKPTPTGANGGKRPSFLLQSQKPKADVTMTNGSKINIKDTSMHSVNASPRGGIAISIPEPNSQKVPSINNLENFVDDIQFTDANETQNMGKLNTGNSFQKIHTTEAFGEDVIKDANQLIDFVVTTKKAIDRFE